MNNLKFLNKLRKKRLDRERKKRLKGYIKAASDAYVKGLTWIIYITEFDDGVGMSKRDFEYLKNWLNKVGIKYSIKVVDGRPIRYVIDFIYEEE